MNTAVPYTHLQETVQQARTGSRLEHYRALEELELRSLDTTIALLVIMESLQTHLSSVEEELETYAHDPKRYSTEISALNNIKSILTDILAAPGQERT